MVGGVAALYSAFILSSHQDTFRELPENVKDLLHYNAVVTTKALEYRRQSNFSYTVIGVSSEVESPITSGIIGGPIEEIGEQLVTLEIQPGWMWRSILIVLTKQSDLVALKGMVSGRFANVLFITQHTYALVSLNSTIVQIGEGTDIKEIFDNNWRNLKGTRIATGLFSYRMGFIEELGVSLGAGVDSSALYEFSKYINITIDLHKISDGVNPFSADLQMIGGAVVLCINARFLTGPPDINKFLEHTTTFLEDAIVVAVRNPPRLRGWGVFASIYRWEVWITLLILIALSCAVLYLVSERRKLSFIIPLALRCICCIPVRKVPNSFKERLLLGPMVFFSNVIVSSFMAGLYHIIEVGQGQKIFETLEEFCESDIPVYSNIPEMETFLDMLNLPAVKKLGSRIETVQAVTDEMLEDGAFVIMERDIRFLIDIDSIRRNVYFIPEKVKTLSVAYAVKRGSPFLDSLSEFTHRSFQAGLYQKWYDMTVQRLRITKGVRRVCDEEGQHKRPLTINDLEVAFFALLSGQSLSVIIFIFEVMIKLLVRRKKRREAQQLQKWKEEQKGPNMPENS